MGNMCMLSGQADSPPDNLNLGLLIRAVIHCEKDVSQSNNKSFVCSRLHADPRVVV